MYAYPPKCSSAVHAYVYTCRVESKKCDGHCTCRLPCMSQYKVKLLCRMISLFMRLMTLFILCEQSALMDFFTTTFYNCEVLQVQIFSREQYQLFLCPCTHNKWASQHCSLFLFQHTYGDDVQVPRQIIKDIKNVTRCRDNRTAKSIETR